MGRARLQARLPGQGCRQKSDSTDRVYRKSVQGPEDRSVRRGERSSAVFPVNLTMLFSCLHRLEAREVDLRLGGRLGAGRGILFPQDFIRF